MFIKRSIARPLAALALTSLSSLTLVHAAEPPQTIFDSHHNFACSPRAEIGCTGLFPTRGEKLGSTQVGLIENGADSLSLRLASLKAARRSIRLQALIFTGDEAGLRIAEILKQKKNEGLDVRVIVDVFSNPSWQTQWMYYDLKQHGIEIEGYESLYLGWLNEVSTRDLLQPNKRFHDKMWVIDGEERRGIAIVGGINIANEYFRVALDAKNRWRDQDVIVRGEVVSDVTAAFDRNFDYFKRIKASRPDLFNTDLSWQRWRQYVVHRFGTVTIPFDTNPVLRSQVADAENRTPHIEWISSRVRFFQNRPRFGESYINQVYLDMINRAEKEILIANAYFIPEVDLIEALTRAARERHVTVNIITNSLETDDVAQISYASRYLYKDLMNLGGSNLHIFEWVGPARNEGTIHAKFAVFDRREMIVGSYNLDSRAKRLNSETVIAIQNAELSARLAHHYLKHDLPLSELVTWQDAIQWHDVRNSPMNLPLALTIKPHL